MNRLKKITFTVLGIGAAVVCARGLFPAKRLYTYCSGPAAVTEMTVEPIQIDHPYRTNRSYKQLTGDGPFWFATEESDEEMITLKCDSCKNEFEVPAMMLRRSSGTLCDRCMDQVQGAVSRETIKCPPSTLMDPYYNAAEQKAERLQVQGEQLRNEEKP